MTNDEKTENETEDRQEAVPEFARIHFRAV